MEYTPQVGLHIINLNKPLYITFGRMGISTFFVLLLSATFQFILLTFDRLGISIFFALLLSTAFLSLFITFGRLGISSLLILSMSVTFLSLVISFGSQWIWSFHVLSLSTTFLSLFLTFGRLECHPSFYFQCKFTVSNLSIYITYFLLTGNIIPPCITNVNCLYIAIYYYW